MDHPEVQRVYKLIGATANKQGKFSGAIANPKNYDKLVAMGYRFLSLGADVIGLTQYRPVHDSSHYMHHTTGPVHVGLDDANLDKIELCEAIRRQVPDFVWHEAPLGEDPDKRNYIVSNEKIRSTGFLPAVSLDRGIAELVRGYRILRRNQYANV